MSPPPKSELIERQRNVIANVEKQRDEARGALNLLQGEYDKLLERCRAAERRAEALEALLKAAVGQ